MWNMSHVMVHLFFPVGGVCRPTIEELTDPNGSYVKRKIDVSARVVLIPWSIIIIANYSSDHYWLL